MSICTVRSMRTEVTSVFLNPVSLALRAGFGSQLEFNKSLLNEGGNEVWWQLLHLPESAYWQYWLKICFWFPQIPLLCYFFRYLLHRHYPIQFFQEISNYLCSTVRNHKKTVNQSERQSPPISWPNIYWCDLTQELRHIEGERNGIPPLETIPLSFWDCNCIARKLK